MVGRVVPVLTVLVALAGCGLSTAPPSSGGLIQVAAAENFWGSIAAQVGGTRVHVTSIISNPNTDPHAYEARPEDARIIARAEYVIVNGAGYDPWAPKLLNANPVPSREVLSVAELVGKREGDNPHLWYAPDYVDRVINRITADLKKIDPAAAAYFDQQNATYRNVGLREYRDTIEAIQRKYRGIPVGTTESMFVYLAQALGLDLVTPPQYVKAVSEGADPSPADKVTIDEQIAQAMIRVFVFNSQNTTPDVNAVVARAKARNIPVTAFTETLAPADASFQEWQTAQLKALLQALGG